MIGVAAEQLIGTNAADLFGSSHRAVLAEFLGSLRARGAGHRSVEICVPISDEPRTIKVTGANQLSNPDVDGLSLLIADLTEQRLLEREVLTIANAERLRLAGEVHDGLSQELAGIALLLQGAATTHDPVPVQHRDLLREIVEHLNHAVAASRDVAEGLSPRYVVGGSFCEAIQLLGHRARPGRAVHVQIDADFDDRTVGGFAADQLYRIAADAAHAAGTFNGGRNIAVALGAKAQDVVLTISDDGDGPEQGLGRTSDLGMRLMEYRTHLLGGTLTSTRQVGSGTIVQVKTPSRNIFDAMRDPGPLRTPTTRL